MEVTGRQAATRGDDMREGPLSQQEAEQLVETATAAPSMRNLQPWRFVVRPADRVIEIYADPSRTLRQADPRGRAVHISCGAALFNLRLAVACAGAEPIARLLPSAPANPLLLASVRIGGPRPPQPQEQDLHAAIHAPRPGTDRQSQASHMLSDKLAAAMIEAASLEGVSLRILDRSQGLRILASMAAADRSLHADPAYLTDHLGAPVPRSFAAQFPASGRLAVLSTRADDRASWLRAGQALQRVLLLAAHHGCPAAPLTQVLDLLDAPARPDPRFGSGFPAMLLRLGPHPAGQTPRTTVRRPVRQIMRLVPDATGHRDERPGGAPPRTLAPSGAAQV